MQVPVSILISVYRNTNSSEFKQAIHSIFNAQTYTPQQLVIVMDGPIPNDLELAIYNMIQEGIPITIVKLERNHGLSYALNIGIANCKYDLIARMDDDDIAVPDRLQLQYEFLLKHPEIHVVGGQVTGWTQDLSKCIIKKVLPCDPNQLKHWIKKRCPLNHPTVMFRKNTILQIGGYPSFYPEDYALWIKLIQRGFEIANLPQILVKMRVEDAIKSRRGLQLLPGEIKLYKLLLDEQFITKIEFVANVFTRIILRSLPASLRYYVYKIFS